MPPTWTEMFLSIWQGSRSPAIVLDDHVMSGEQLLQYAMAASTLLNRLHICPGEGIPLLMDESVDAIAMTVGGALSRRPMAPLGTKLPVPELAAIVQNMKTDILFTSPEHEGKARQITRRARTRLHVVNGISPGGDQFDLQQSPGPDDIMLVIHTSGTTGVPKPVPMHQRGFAARTLAYQEMTDTGPGDRFSSTSPFYHVAGAGMALTALGMGAALLPMRWFNIEEWRRVGRLGMSYGQLVPTMIEMLLEHGALGGAVPRILQYGGAPIHPETLKSALEILPDTRFVQFFGQTEASPLTCLDCEDHQQAIADNPDLLLSVGRAIPGCKIAIENPDSDGVGEVIAQAELCFLRDKDGWRRTGDLGWIDEQGYLYLTGRKNDRIIRGGENINPAEVEAVLAKHPAVKDVAVVGIPNRRWGEIVRAVIVPSVPDCPPTIEDLRAFCGEKLARFKLPEEACLVDVIPRNPTGKILRRLLPRGR